MSKKMMSIANFNVVFIEKNKKEEPLLEYFDSIVMPAFLSKIKRDSKGTKYYILNARVIEVEEDEYALVGNFVKETKLEVKSEVNEEGELVECDNVYPAAPFSTFVIYLKNHRMVFIRNQQGSPTLQNFETSIRHILIHYVKMKNDTIENEEKKLPRPEVTITAIPTQGKLKEFLVGAKTVNSLTLSFHPLNGDLVDLNGALDGVATDIRQFVGSNTGKISFNTPTSIDGITKLVENSPGTVLPKIKVTYPDKSTKTIMSDDISEKIEIDIAGNNPVADFNYLAAKGLENYSISTVSDKNAEIYQDNLGKIIPFHKR